MSARWGGGRQSRCASRFDTIRYSMKPADARLTGLVYATFRSLQPPPPRMMASFASGVIECKGLEIRPIRGGYMLTNQRRATAGYCYQILTNQSEGARNLTNQSLPPECACAKESCGYKRQDLHFSSFPSVTRTRNDVDWRRNLVELSKNTSVTCRRLESSDNSTHCCWRTFNSGAT